MQARAETSVFWPGITADIKKIRERCIHCNTIAPSQPSPPPTAPTPPDYPFQSICSDYFTKEGYGYLVTVDRYSNWPSVQQTKDGEANSKNLITELKKHCATFGIPEELSSDGGSQFTSRETQQFLENYGIRSRVSSVAYPHSNTRAEIGVKTMKRLISDNTGPGGTLNTDKVLRAMLQYRNTPDPETGLSPAQVIFGHQIRDFTPVLPGKYQPRQEWRETMEKREEALRKRHTRAHERLSEHTVRLPPLKVGDTVFIQNQSGNYPRRWDKSGVCVEVRQHDQYVIKVDGSGRLTLRNRKFLRKFSPYSQGTRSPPVTRLPNVQYPTTDQTSDSVSAPADDVVIPDASDASHPPVDADNNSLPPKLEPNTPFAHPRSKHIELELHSPGDIDVMPERLTSEVFTPVRGVRRSNRQRHAVERYQAR